jgi:hypothetical protein
VTDIWDTLNDTTDDLIGDHVTYTVVGGSPVSLTAFLDQSDVIIGLGNTSAVTPEPSIQIQVSKLAQPQRGDRIVLPNRPETFAPKTWERDASGRFWNINLGRVSA